jgi:hypothetical protein
MSTLKTKTVPFALALALAAGALGTASAAHAQTHGRNFYVGVGLGFGVGFSGGAYFRLEENVGYHVLNVDEHPGLYVGAALSQGVAGLGALINFAGRIGFDILAWQNTDLAFLVNPFIQLGGGFGTGGGVTRGYFYMVPGVDLALSLVEGLIYVYWRPLSFEVAIGDGGGTGAYSMMFGVNFNF